MEDYISIDRKFYTRKVTRNDMSAERLKDDVETVKVFSCLGNALYANGGFKMTVV